MKPEATIIIAFYNNFRFLELVIAGLERQSMTNFEVIIADDGSNKGVVNKVDNLIKNSPLEIIHVWHEDQGWRKNIILNKAIIKSRGDYLIFLDGDCIPHGKFVADHLANKQKALVISGRRTDLSPAMTRSISRRKISRAYLEKSGFVLHFLHVVFGKGRKFKNAIHVPSTRIRNLLPHKKQTGILGSNFSAYKEDILAVNGFDERYLQPGVGEDSDLGYRMVCNGNKTLVLKNLCIQYHLFHQKKPRGKENMVIFEETKRLKRARTPFGINQ